MSPNAVESGERKFQVAEKLMKNAIDSIYSVPVHERNNHRVKTSNCPS